MQLEVVENAPQPMLYIRRRCALDMAEIGRQVGSAFDELGRFIAAHRITPLGPPLTVYSDWTSAETTIHVGFPVSATDRAKAAGNVMAGETPGGTALKTVHRGPYGKLSDTYAELEREMARLGIAMGTRSWELYPVDPETTPPDKLVTEIYMQISPADAAKVPAAEQKEAAHGA